MKNKDKAPMVVITNCRFTLTQTCRGFTAESVVEAMKREFDKRLNNAH